MNFGDPRLPERFWAKVQPCPMTGCWIWVGAMNSNGYGRVWNGDEPGYSHRFAYQSLVGEIPDGKQIDHRCRVRPCCNPAHLEPVSNAENVRRGLRPQQIANENRRRGALQTHCIHGHEFTADNTYQHTHGNGLRGCRTCMNARARARYRRTRASA